MVPTAASLSPNIGARLLDQPSDVEALEKLYFDIFPDQTQRAKKLFQGMIHRNDIVSWVAVDHAKLDQIVGFVIARSLPAKDSEIEDLLKHDNSTSSTLFILALGVLQSYRNLGVGSLLIKQAVTHAYGTPYCRAIYLHVVYDNDHAIRLYKKLEFKLMRTLGDYYITDEGHGCDGYLFVHFVN